MLGQQGKPEKPRKPREARVAKDAIEAKKAKEAKEAARNNIRMMMGDAVGATLPDGTTFTYKTVYRKGYVVRPKQSRQLRMKRGRKSV